MRIWCKYHQKYKGLRYPRGGCADCLTIWKLMEGLRHGWIQHRDGQFIVGNTP